MKNGKPMNRLNYFCVVEGQQEEMYLKRFAELLSDFPRQTVTFNTVINNAEQLRRSYAEYDKVCLFDHDFKPMEFERSIKTCLELDADTNRRTGQRVWHAYSSICFDLWLVLHKEFIGRSANSPKEYIPDVIRVYDLPKGADIKQAKVIERIVKQIELEDIKRAVSNVRKIRKDKLPKDKCFIAGTSGGFFYYSDPDFSIDIFVEHVMEKMGIKI